MADNPPAGGGAFPETRWSLIARAGLDAGTLQRQALSTVMERYLPALRCHLVYRKRIDPHTAEDLVHGFLLNKVLEQNLLGKAEQSRGRFRTFLLTALDRYMLNQVRDAKAQKRAGKGQVSLDGQADPVAPEPGADSFEIAWARQVLEHALNAMREECQASGRRDVWGVFEARVVKPALAQEEPVSYGELVAQFGLTSPTQASNILVTANRMFVRHLRAVVGEYEQDDARIDAELGDLREILSRSGAGAH